MNNKPNIRNKPASTPADRGRGRGPGDERPRNVRRPRTARPERSRPEFDQKLLGVRRVTRVVAGGRRFAFSVSIIIGNRRGSVGVGIGKASDTALAIEKAFRHARKNMIEIKKTKNMSIPHEVRAKYASSEVVISPAYRRGLVAGSAVRNVFELAGMTDITSKILTRSKNKLNIARATIKALEQL